MPIAHGDAHIKIKKAKNLNIYYRIGVCVLKVLKVTELQYDILTFDGVRAYKYAQTYNILDWSHCKLSK